MQATIEISLYPLSENYESSVLKFIEDLNKYPQIKVETNGLSTQIFGDFHFLMKVLTDEIYEVFEREKAVLLIKLAAGELRYEK